MQSNPLLLYITVSQHPSIQVQWLVQIKMNIHWSGFGFQNFPKPSYRVDVTSCPWRWWRWWPGQRWHIAGWLWVCSQPVCCCHQWLMMLPAFHNYVIHHFLALTGTNTPASRHTLISGPLSKQLRIKTFINFLFYLEGIFAVIVGIWLMLTIQTLRCSLLTERGHIPSCNLTITDKYYLLLDYRLAKL